jgi:hypothetical protein
MLYVTGRDVDESEYALRFTPAAGAWTLLDGPPGDYALSETRAAITRHVRANPGSTPKAIADATGLSADNVRKTCQRMATDGQLIADAAGRYRPAGTPGTPDRTETVLPVPAVPQPGLTWGNETDHEGHPDRSGVPAVPEPGIAAYTDEEPQ